MAVTTSGVAVGGLPTVVADAVIAFNQNAVMFPLVSRMAMPGGLTAQWSDYTKISSSSVSALTNGGDQTTVTSLTTSARQATISEHVLRIDLTDLAAKGNVDGIEGNVGPIIGNSVAAKNDADLTALFTGFSQTEAGAGTTLALSHIFGAIRQLKIAVAPMPYNLVLSPKQVWGTKGLYPLLVQTGNSTTNTAVPHSLLGMEGQEFLTRGFVGNIGGVDVYYSNEISEDVGSGGDAAAGMFSRGAIGLAHFSEGLFRIEQERNASARLTENVGTGFWGETEIKDAFGVYILSDVS